MVINKFTILIVFFLVIFILIGSFFLLKQPIFDFFNVANAQTSTIQATVNITVCGNGILETGEECDGTDFGGQTCTGLGYTGGTLSCSSACSFDTSACTTGGGGGGGGGSVAARPPAETKVVLQGKAYPNAEITILKDGQLAVITPADPQANFKVEVTDLTAGTYTFGVWAEDKNGRRSITFNFTVAVSSGTITTISNIFISPTIELERTNLEKGEILNILGQTVPQSKVNIHVESPGEIIRKAEANEEGDWQYPFDTDILDEGSHTARAKAVSPDGVLSTYSNTLAFVVGGEGTIILMKRGDINMDGRINLVDFSILLYNWGIPKNLNADLNSDGKVNLVDFSIMLYWWTG